MTNSTIISIGYDSSGIDSGYLNYSILVHRGDSMRHRDIKKGMKVIPRKMKNVPDNWTDFEEKLVGKPCTVIGPICGGDYFEVKRGRDKGEFTNLELLEYKGEK